jgi:hypothetical protein
VAIHADYSRQHTKAVSPCHLLAGSVPQNITAALHGKHTPAEIAFV